MYFRPSQVFKDFILESNIGDTNSKGRATNAYQAADPAVIIKGALADATPDEKERWKQMQHPITHTIVQKGAPIAQVNDRLKLGGRRFYVQTAPENPGNLDMWTLYRVEERRDA